MNLVIPRFEINRKTIIVSPKRAMIVSAIVIFLNAPVAVFITSYRFLVLSHLWPEYALLLPVQDEKGKF